MFLDTFTTTLKNTIEIAIFLGAVSGSLRFFGRRANVALRNVLIGVVPGAVLFTYLILPGIDKQGFDLLASAASAAALMILVAVVWVRARSRKDDRPKSESAAHEVLGRGSGRRPGVLAAVLTAVAIFGDLTAVARQPSRFPTPNDSYLTTETILAFAAYVVGIVLVLILATLVKRSIVRLDAARSALWVTLALTPIIVSQLTTMIQMLLVTGRLTVSLFIFGVIAAMINGRALFLNAGLAAILILSALTAGVRPRQRAEESLNPAVKRRLKAELRSNRRLVVGLALSALVVGFSLRSEAVFAVKQVELSPAKTVKAVDGIIKIPLTTIKDKRLHRFAVEHKGAKIRFIAVHKGSGVYSSAFDACENCGTVGYYEKSGNLVCKNCDAYISVATLGLPGGCNPIPLKSLTRDGYLKIDLSDLAADKGRR